MVNFRTKERTSLGKPCISRESVPISTAPVIPEDMTRF